MATLIDIHYAVSSRSEEPQNKKEPSNSRPPPPYPRIANCGAVNDHDIRSTSPEAAQKPAGLCSQPSSPSQAALGTRLEEEQAAEENLISDGVLEDRGVS